MDAKLYTTLEGGSVDIAADEVDGHLNLACYSLSNSSSIHYRIEGGNS